MAGASRQPFRRWNWQLRLGLALVATIGGAVCCKADDSPYHVHCNAAADIGDYYGADSADVYQYVAAQVRNFVFALTAPGHYGGNSDFAGASIMYVGVDLIDHSATLFFYGDNGCAFGYDDGWDADSIATQLSELKLDLPATPAFVHSPKAASP